VHSWIHLLTKREKPARRIGKFGHVASNDRPNCRKKNRLSAVCSKTILLVPTTYSRCFLCRRCSVRAGSALFNGLQSKTDIWMAHAQGTWRNLFGRPQSFSLSRSGLF